MKDVKQFMRLFKRAPPGCALLVSKKGMAAVEFALHTQIHANAQLGNTEAWKRHWECSSDGTQITDRR